MHHYTFTCVLCNKSFEKKYKKKRKPSQTDPKYCKDCRRKMSIQGGLKRHGLTQKLDRYYKSGYVMIRNKEGRTIQEHRAILEEILGRPLQKTEHVHHKNGIRDDNRPENLEVWIVPHPPGQRASDLICPHCKKVYLSEPLVKVKVPVKTRILKILKGLE